MTEGLWQVLVGSVAALIGLLTGVLVWIQTRGHFRLTRSSEYIQRFNSQEFFGARVIVDSHSTTPGALALVVMEGEVSSDEAKVRKRSQILMFANLFQELGGSYRKRTVDRHHTWIMFGHLVQLYWNRLQPAIEALRLSRKRPQLYQDFEHLAREMGRLDKKYAKEHVVTPSRPGVETPPVTRKYVFAYGSLVNPKSIRKSLGHVAEEDLRVAWLNDYERSFSLIAKVGLEGEGPQECRAAAFLNVRPSTGAIVNGVLVPVSDADLLVLDQREKQYQRVDVTSHVQPRLAGIVFTYSRVDVGNLSNAQIPEEYLKIVNEGISYWGEGFADEFKKRTVGDNLSVFAGSYRFLDAEQDRAAGRS